MARRNLRFISYVDTTLILTPLKKPTESQTPDFYLVMPAERIGLGHLKIQILVFKFEINKVWKNSTPGLFFKGNINNLTWVGGEIYVQQNSNIKINNVTSFVGFNGVGNGSDKLPSYIEIDYFNNCKRKYNWIIQRNFENK
jgi:hypothetical protein